MSREVLSILAGLLQEVPVTQRPQYVGVYLLVDGDEVVYVGQSLDVEYRVQQHVAQHTKDFDRALWIPLAEVDLDDYEAALIQRLVPKYNTKAPRSFQADRIATVLGLPLPDLARAAEYLARRERAYPGGHNPGSGERTHAAAKVAQRMRARRLWVAVDAAWKAQR